MAGARRPAGVPARSVRTAGRDDVASGHRARPRGEGRRALLLERDLSGRSDVGPGAWVLRARQLWMADHGAHSRTLSIRPPTRTRRVDLRAESESDAGYSAFSASTALIDRSRRSEPATATSAMVAMATAA